MKQWRVKGVGGRRVAWSGWWTEERRAEGEEQGRERERFYSFPRKEFGVYSQ